MAPEVCGSPLKEKCDGREIAVYIYLADGKIPVCRECWRRIAESDLEWSLEVKMEELKMEAKKKIGGEAGR